MLMSLLMLMILLTSFTIFMSTNPLSMGVLILLLALMTTLSISVSMSPWLSFLVFLIYISGMLVLFSYFVAISPNIPMPSLIINLLLLMSVPLTLTSLFLLPSNSPMLMQPELYITHMYSAQSSSTLILLALILLLTMVIVVKLISMKNGPLRPFMS